MAIPGRGAHYDGKIMNYIERTYPWLLLSPVILPVVMWSGVIYPYLVPKTLFFYALSLLMAGAFVVLVAHKRAFYWARLTRWETWIPGAMLALAYTASAYGLDFYRSFWSLFIRGDGLLMLTCVVGSFYLILLYVDRRFFEQLLRCVAVIGSSVAVFGIGEWLISGGRIGSLLGNAAFFAGYLGVAVFVTITSAETLPRSWRNWLYGGAALQVIAIILTATRGTMLALAFALIAALVYHALFRPESPKAKNGVRLGLAARSAPFFAFGDGGRTSARILLTTLVLIGGLFFAFRGELSNISFEPVARIASISLTDGTVSSRLFIWKNMVMEIQKSPWLGVGAEHIDTLFNRFYDPSQIYEQWFDRSHNAFLDYAAQYGIGGFLLYATLIATLFMAANRIARRERIIGGIFILLGVTYAIQNFFVFDTISSFWLLLALLATLIAQSIEETPRTILPVSTWMRGIAWLIALVLCYLILPVSIRPGIAAYDLAHAYLYQITDVPKEVRFLSRGFALGTYGDLEYGYQVYDMYVNIQIGVLTGVARVDAYNAALTILSKNFNRYAYDGRTALYLAHVLSLAPEGETVDHNLLSSALTRAIETSPKRSQAWYILANLSISNANKYPPGSKEQAAGYAAAADILHKYIALVPTLSAPHFVLAQLLYASGQKKDAAVEASKGKDYYSSDLETARRAVGYYETVKDWKEASFFLREIVTIVPQDTNARYDLAKVMYLSGDPAAAKIIVDELRTLDPAILGTDQNFLDAITAYEQSTN